MNYYKNIEIARKYNVSVDTVANWITGSLENRNRLEIYYYKGRNYIINNATNNTLLEIISTKSKKFRNSKSARKITPQNAFYKLFSEKQIIDIVYNLDELKEIPFKYYNLGRGAEYWDDYVKRLLVSKESASIKRTIAAFNQNLDYIFSLVQSYDKVNVIDIGVGNGMHIRPLLEFLLNKNLLRKYIGIDISQRMHDISYANYKSWFGNSFNYESYIMDINYDTFQHIAQSNTNPPNSTDKIANIIVYVGSCIENQRTYFQSIQVVQDSISKNDIFILGHIVDNLDMRAHLYLSERERLQNSDLELMTYLLELLNISSDLYELYRYYDIKEKARIILIKPKVDIYLKILTKHFQKELRLFAKNDIRIFRHNHHTAYEAIEILNEMKFSIKHTNVSEDNNQIMIIAKTNKNGE